jgi:hypothetical protein
LNRCAVLALYGFTALVTPAIEASESFWQSGAETEKQSTVLQRETVTFACALT